MKGAYCLHFVSVDIFLTFISVHILYALCIQITSLKKVKKAQNLEDFFKRLLIWRYAFTAHGLLHTRTIFKFIGYTLLLSTFQTLFHQGHRAMYHGQYSQMQLLR